MGWTGENEPTINNEPTNYEEPELTLVELQKKCEESNELLHPSNRKLDRLEEAMNNTLNEEQTANGNYRSKTLRDIENKIKRQRVFLAPYIQKRI